VGQGFGDFLDLYEKVFFLIQYPGAVLLPAGRVFRIVAELLTKNDRMFLFRENVILMSIQMLLQGCDCINQEWI